MHSRKHVLTRLTTPDSPPSGNYNNSFITLGGSSGCDAPLNRAAESEDTSTGLSPARVSQACTIAIFSHQHATSMTGHQMAYTVPPYTVPASRDRGSYSPHWVA